MLLKLLPTIFGFSITAFLIFALNPLAHRIGWVDKPDNARKLHGGAIPLTGGVAMMLAYLLVQLWKFGSTQSFDSVNSPLLGAMLAMCLVGLWDDVKQLSAYLRIFIQAIVGLAMVLTSHLNMNDLGNILGFGSIVMPNALSVAFTVFCIVGSMNAINMIDGVDGLAGGVVLVALMWMAFLTSVANTAETTVLLLLIGCILGYLFYNMRSPFRKKAVAFMGDSGSMMLGVGLAWLLISLSQHRGDAKPIIPPVVGLWIVTVPLLDTISLMISRVLDGKSPFAADRSHFHHILQDAGLSPAETTCTILFIAAALGGVGTLGWKLGISEAVLFYAFIVLGCSYYYFIHHTEKLAGIVSCVHRKLRC